ncbi:hypothetical protein X777_00695 [Ooceraea biroi]|uniref:Tc1-like transposase DDE domain-containing protein n=1 Tax=Ooceraea biroi TaxID=2015173 RepID=A0A026WUU0_OOCBI|nr:hypothetical protein X777_00695 [Ooceraea biroi]
MYGLVLLEISLLDQFFSPLSTLNGNNYRQFLETQLPILLEDVSLQIRNQLWFMHDGTPAYFSRTAREFLNNNYINRWIGRGGPIVWPARSSALNPLDFYLWGHLRLSFMILLLLLWKYSEIVLSLRVAKYEIFWKFLKVFESMRRRCEACINEEGNHFQQFL